MRREALAAVCIRDTYKSAPMVALYWVLNRLFTYWFMSDVFPTLKVNRNIYFKLSLGPRGESENKPAVAKDDDLRFGIG